MPGTDNKFAAQGPFPEGPPSMGTGVIQRVDRASYIAQGNEDPLNFHALAHTWGNLGQLCHRNEIGHGLGSFWNDRVAIVLQLGNISGASP